MINFKEWNVKHLGDIVVSIIVLLLGVAFVMGFISPVLTAALPAVFTKLTLTDTLLLLILLRLHSK
ncbi:MAG: hypothetical protein K0R98_183 [Rickettsiaceae bacterium]|jgi:hypothetical protein|nr:hypothetical protein [Rickettsiaceae bacterium]